MPKSGGLPDVSQAIRVDSSAAVSGYQAAADAAEEFASRNTAALRSMQDDLRQTKQMLDDFQRQVSGTTGVPLGIGEWEAVMAAQRLAKQGITEYASEVSGAGEAVEELADSHAGLADNVHVASDALRDFRVNAQGVAEAVKAIDFQHIAGNGIESLNESVLSWQELHQAIQAVPQAFELVSDAADRQRLSIEGLSDIQKEAMNIAKGFATSQSDVRILVDSAGNAITNLSSGYSGFSGNLDSANSSLGDHVITIGKAVERYNDLGDAIARIASSGGTVGQGFQGGGTLYDLAQALVNSGFTPGGTGGNDFIAGAIGSTLGSMMTSGGGGFSGGGSSYYGSYGGAQALPPGASYVRGYTDTGEYGGNDRFFQAYSDMTAAAAAGSWLGGSGSYIGGFPGGTAGAHTGAGGGSGGGGGGGLLGGIAGGLIGGGSGGGGGLGGFFSSGFGDLFGNGGKADQQWDSVAKFLTTWYPRFHWAMMATNEILATAGPATVAALTAGAVGLEGGQTAYGRISAVNAVGQSLGAGIGGETPGQILGLGNALQKAQTAADPQVWELMGAAMNTVKAGTDSASGGLGNFWQLGTNTIDMMDRFGASVALAFQGGEGKKLNDIVQGGTQDLQQFGDVIGNVGKTFLNVAPSLPGVGGDILSTLDFATGTLAKAAGIGTETGLLGPLLALEAGSRYGPAIVGGAGALVGRVGTGLTAATGGGGFLGSLGGLLGSQRTAATAKDVEYAAANGLPAIEEGDMIGGSGIAGAMGGMTALGVGGLAASVYLAGKGLTYQSPEQQLVGGMEAAAGQAPISKSVGDLLTSMSKLGPAAKTPESMAQKNYSPYQNLFTGIEHGNLSQAASGWEHLLLHIPEPSTQSVAQSGEQKFAGQLNELLGAGQQVAKAFGTDLPSAFSLADMAGLQMSTAFNKNGQLTATAIQQVKDTITGYQAMSQGGTKGLEASVNAVQATQGLAAAKVGTVNTAWDTFLNNAAGGTTAAVGFASGIQALGDLSLPAAKGAPSAKTVKDIQAALGVSPSDARALAASGGTAESFKSIAKALEGFTSPASQEAWAAFSNTSTSSPGLLQQVGSTLDTLRIAQTSSVLSPGQVAAAGMYQAKQLVPYAKQSPAALAELGVLSQETGGPGYNAKESQAENYKNISKYVDQTAASTKQYNQIMNDQAIGMSNVSQQAQTFGSTMQIDAYGALAEGSVNVPKMTSDMENFKKSLSPTGEAKSFGSSAQGLAQDFASVKASAGDVKDILGEALSGKGMSTSQISSAIAKVQADINKLDGKDVKITAKADDAEIKKLEQEINSLQNKSVRVVTQADIGPVVRLALELASIHSKTISITEQLRTIGSLTPVGGVASGTISGGGGGMRLTNSATGMRVPGFGGGDIFPAMLEPGEAVIPKHLVGMVAPFLGAHGVPGFAAGGIMGDEMLNVFSLARNTATSALGGGSMSGQQWQNVYASFMRAAMIARQMQGATGFASGGIVPDNTLAGVKSQLDAEYKILDSMYAANDSKSSIDAFWSSALDPLYAKEDALEGKTSSSSSSSSTASASNAAKDFAFTLTGQIANAVKSSSQASTIATALINKIGTEISYAKNVSAAALTGTGYGTGGLLGTFTASAGPSGANAAPPGAPGYNAAAWNAAVSNAANDTAPAQTVQQQMQSYLSTVNSFTKDLHTATKDGLNKSLISQAVAAGPTQGDALIQSILSGTGGVKSANSLWAQIGTASNKLGAQSAMSEYGGIISPNLKSASVTSNNISISINAGSGATLSLSTSQIKALVEQVQAALLKQAKRNPKTGLKLTGKGS